MEKIPQIIKFSRELVGKPELLDEQKYYDYQCNQLAAYIILEDKKPHIHVDSCKIQVIDKPKLTFINRGELISGSMVSCMAASSLSYLTGGDLLWPVKDMDIYFKSKEDAFLFCTTNNMFTQIDDSNPVCGYIKTPQFNINTIWGIHYDSPEHLISNFDIRACSMAWDPNSDTLFAVSGSIEDAKSMKINFNPTPNSVSVRRLVKYAQKGFNISAKQRLFFVDLLKSDMFDPILEVITGY
jgi:hypothetical protein